MTRRSRRPTSPSYSFLKNGGSSLAPFNTAVKGGIPADVIDEGRGEAEGDGVGRVHHAGEREDAGRLGHHQGLKANAVMPNQDPLTASRPLVELREIRKAYGDLVVNDGVNLTLRRGEVHALLGENGAGKTTLMRILYGLTRPDRGQILIDGVPTSIASPKDAIRLRHRHGHAAFLARDADDRDGERHALRGRARPAEPLGSTGESARGRGRAGRHDRPRRPRRAPVGRRAAAGRDPQGALPRLPGADPRRADCGARAAGRRGAVRDRSPDHRAGTGCAVHQPQAARGRVGQRPGQRAASRPHHRHDRRGGCRAALSRRAHGRPADHRGPPGGHRAARDRRPRGREGRRGRQTWTWRPPRPCPFSRSRT